MNRHLLAAVLLLLVAVGGCQAHANHKTYRHAGKGRNEVQPVVTIRKVNLRRDHLGNTSRIPPMPNLPVFDLPGIDDTPKNVAAPGPKPGKRLAPFRISKTGWAPKGKRKWKYIVIHHSATPSGNAAQFDRFHRQERGWVNGLGYDFVIGNGRGSRDGQVEVGPRWRRQINGAHAGNEKYNKYGIGICLVGNFDKSKPSKRQWRAMVELVHFMQKRYKIPDSRIKMHHEIRAHGTTHCPGANFSVNTFYRYLRARKNAD